MPPIFVYGTLRPGSGNHGLWSGYAEAVLDGDVRLTGYRLVTNGSFPYAIPAPDETTVGCLIVPEPDHYNYVLARMDRLEGVPTHYSRVAVSVDGPMTKIVAWLYTPTSDRYHSELGPVPGNDWALTRNPAIA